MPMIDLLTDVELDEISLVNAGANLKKRFPVVKARLTGVIEKAIEQKANAEDELRIKLIEKAISEETVGIAIILLRIIEQCLPNCTPYVLEEIARSAGVVLSNQEFQNQMQKSMEVKPMDEKQMQEQLTAIQNSNKETLDAVEKKHAEDLAKRDAQIKELADARAVDNWVAKAKTDLSHFPGKSAEELGVMLKALNDVSPEMANTQFASMKAASDALKSSSALKEIGCESHLNTGSGKALDRINQLVDGLITKDVTTTRAKAFTIVLKAHPELYQEYLDENPAQFKRS